MHIYIVATYRNGKDESKITDYLLLDIDDNFKTLKVSKEQLVNVLSQNKIKLFNAKLSTTGIIGTYYSLNRLPSFRYDLLDTNFRMIILSKNDKNTEFLNCLVTQNGVSVSKIDFNTINNYFSQGYICNIGDNYLPLCEKIETPKNKKPQINLDKDVNNVDSEWTIEMFVTYMKSKGYSYKLYNESGFDGYVLCDIDPRCEVIHIPVGVTVVSYLYEQYPPEKIKGIIIPKTLNIFDKFCQYKSNLQITNDDYDNEKFMKVDYVYFQNKGMNKQNYNNLGDYNGLQQLSISKFVNCPAKKNVKYLFCYCEINCAININNISTLDKSFFMSQLNDEVNINARKITNSFRKIEIHDINIGDNVEVIDKSFSKLVHLFRLDFSKAINLCSISASFIDNDADIDDLNLSNCKKLRSIALKSFSEFIIGKIELSNSVTSIDLQSFYKCLVWTGEVRLPACLKKLDCRAFSNNGGDTKLIFNKQTTSITDLLMLNYDKRNISFEGKVTEIETNTYYQMEDYCEFDDLHIPESVVEIHTRAFCNSKLIDFDSRKLPLIHSIPEECFLNSHIETVIIGDNIESIGEKAFKKCNNLRTIVISDKVRKISNNAFSDIHGDKITTIYVVKGSYAAKKLANTKESLIELDSFDKIIEDIFNKQTTPEEKIAKFRLMLNGSEYESLLDKPEYARNINFIYKFVQYIENNKQDTTISIDTSKYKSMNIPDSMNDLIIDYQRRINSIITDSDGIKKLKRNNVFASLSNLITKLCDNDERLYTSEFLLDVLKKGHISNIQSLYFDDTKAIYDISVEIFTNVHFEIIVIIVDGKIKFMHGIETLCITRYIAYDDDMCILRRSFEAERSNPFKVSFTKFLKTGDSLTPTVNRVYLDKYNADYSDYRISGVEIPNRIGDDSTHDIGSTLKSMIKNNWIFIGTTVPFYETLRRQVAYNEKRNYPTLFYDIIEQKFIEVVAKFKFRGSKIENINMYTVINVYDLSDINKIDKQYFSEMTEALNDKSTNNAIELASLDNELIERAYNDINNYDINGNKNIMDLADAIYKYNIDDVAKLNIQSANVLLQSEFFELSELTMNKIRKEDKTYKIEFAKQLHNSDALFIQCRVNKDNYIMGVIQPDTLMNKKGILYHSVISMKDMLKTLWIIGEHRSIGNDTSLNKIVNTKINVDNFVFIKTLCDNQDGLKYDIALDKFNGDAYVIGEQWDSDFYTLFRFKHLLDAYNFLYTTFDGGISVLRGLCMKIISDKDSSNCTARRLYKNRESIINGLPNNFPYLDDPCDIMDKLSKQH